MTSISTLVDQILAEFREMPGLSVTAAQGSRLWGADVDFCEEVLEALAAAGYLRRSPDGRYGSPAGDGVGRTPQPRGWDRGAAA
jgi:hypothetical protein